MISYNFDYIKLYKSPQRKLQSPDDWGDQETVGIHLKRKGKKYHHLGDDDFGYYLGKLEESFIVGIKNFPSYNIKHYEVYGSLEELQRDWTSD